MKRKVKALDYYEKFRCIGSACEANCCNSWVIYVDPTSYKKYQQIDRENGTEYFRHIGLRGEQPVISLNGEGYCPYLATDNLCNMVKDFDDSFLSVVCRTYPRQGRLISHENTVYLSCVLSCPQVMRLAVVRKKRLTYLDLGSLASQIPIYTAYSDGKRTPEHDQVLDAIHHAFIALVQESDVSLNKRMTALLLVCSRAAKLEPLTNVEDALTVLEGALHVAKTGFSEIPDLPGDLGNQFKVLVLLTAKVLLQKRSGADHPAKKNLFALIDQSFAGLGITSFDKITDDHFSLYLHGKNTLVDPYFSARPHLWENLLAHYLMTTNFPFTKNKPPLFNLVYLGILLLFCRGLLTGYALSKGQVDETDFVHVFHMIFREIDHNPNSTAVFNEFAEEIKADSLGQLYTILNH